MTLNAKDLISQVRRLEIRTRRIVDELTGGAYHSCFKGHGMEFEEVREYLPGDDVRDIDWNVTARLGIPFIKKYVEERELHVILAVDISRSGFFASGEKSKLRTAAELAALLSLSAIRNNDKVGLITFSDQIETHLPAKSGRRHVLRLIRDLVAASPRGTGTDLGCLMTHLQNTLHKRSVIFLISDFISNSSWEKSLSVLSQRHDFIAIRIIDPIERNWLWKGNWNFTDLENQNQVFIQFQNQGQNYADLAQVQSDYISSIFKKSKAGLIDVFCGHDPVIPLMRYFNKRSRK